MIGAAAIFLVGECVGLVLFAIVRGILSQNFDIERKLLEIFKGALERLVITAGLVLNFPQILIMFAALKLANRLKHEGDDDEMRNYFLIGNLISVPDVFCLFLPHRTIWRQRRSVSRRTGPWRSGWVMEGAGDTNGRVKA